MKQYSVAFKHKMVERLFGADAPSASELFKEVGIPQEPVAMGSRGAYPASGELRQAGCTNAQVDRRTEGSHPGRGFEAGRRTAQRELARKEKALAEAAALLILKKKSRTCTR